MPVEVITKQDLVEFEQHMLREIQKIIDNFAQPPEEKTWLKSEEVKLLLKMSTSTLQKLRNNGTVKCAKIGGILYYDYHYIRLLLDKR